MLPHPFHFRRHPEVLTRHLLPGEPRRATAKVLAAPNERIRGVVILFEARARKERALAPSMTTSIARR
jgi:hypothetical protein